MRLTLSLAAIFAAATIGCSTKPGTPESHRQATDEPEQQTVIEEVDDADRIASLSEEEQEAELLARLAEAERAEGEFELLWPFLHKDKKDKKDKKGKADEEDKDPIDPKLAKKQKGKHDKVAKKQEKKKKKLIKLKKKLYAALCRTIERLNDRHPHVLTVLSKNPILAGLFDYCLDDEDEGEEDDEADGEADGEEDGEGDGEADGSGSGEDGGGSGGIDGSGQVDG